MGSLHKVYVSNIIEMCQRVKVGLSGYKGTWANVRRVGSQEDFVRTISFKSRSYDRV
jgi:hypothetical protein